MSGKKASQAFGKMVAKTIEAHRLFSTDDTLLVALSGGADSVALLLVLHRLGYHIEALHCNFHLRDEESNRDERFVRELCHRLQIALYVKDFDTRDYCKRAKVSIETGARDLRYAWFEEMRTERNAAAICVAHHSQDQAETLLMNLVRGTGLRGLAGMHHRNGWVVRPLLDCSRQDIIDFLHEQQQDWVEDSTNAEREATRNKIRLDVLPLLQSINAQAINNISRTASIIQETIPIYERGLHSTEGKPSQQAENEKAERVHHEAKERVCASLTELHEYVTGCGFTPTQERNIWEAATGAIVESDTHRLLRDRYGFILQKKDEEAEIEQVCTSIIRRSELASFEKSKAYLDNASVLKPLKVRRIRPGDRFQPFGMKGTKLVSDLLTDMKLSRFEKERQCVLCDAEGNILWVIGLRASNLCRVTEQTDEILVVSQKNNTGGQPEE